MIFCDKKTDFSVKTHQTLKCSKPKYGSLLTKNHDLEAIFYFFVKQKNPCTSLCLDLGGFLIISTQTVSKQFLDHSPLLEPILEPHSLF